MRRPFLIRLRPTLLATIVGLVLFTALAIGGTAALLTVSVTRNLIDQARASAVNTAREETRQLFGEPARIVTELAAAAHRGALPLADRDRLAAIFAEELRVTPRLAFIGYGNIAGGWYVGASRSDAGEIVEYQADPAIDDGVPQEAIVAADGTRTPPKPSGLPPYLVTTRPWFKQGIAAPGLVWSQFYKFTTGVTGITSMSRFTPLGANAPAGVFHADLRIDGIAGLLSSLRFGESGTVFLIDPNGNRIVTPKGDDARLAAKAIDAVAVRQGVATLASPARTRIGRRFYEVVFEPVPIEGDVGLSVGVAVDLHDLSGGAIRHAIAASVVALVALILAVLCGRALSSRIATPVVAIAQDLAKIGSFNLSRDPAPRSFIREVSELGGSVDRMKASLRSFAHYVPTDLVRTLLAQGKEAELGGEIRRLTIHFSDVADFTTISEGMDPDRLVEAMGHYLELMTGALTRHGGTVDKFIGDGVMAFFNAPEELPDHPRQACLAALEAQALLKEMAAATPPGGPVFRARIGLGLGEVLVGNIGTEERFAYTLLGDEVNLASRLEGLNKVYGTAIIASQTVMDEAADGFEWRRLDRVAVKGRTQGTPICELLGEKDAVPAELLRARDTYERALALYLDAAFEAAAELFAEAARQRPGDLAAATMRDRCFALANDPPAQWDGVHVMEQK